MGHRTVSRRMLLQGGAAAFAVRASAQEPTHARAFAATTEDKDVRQSQLFLDDTWIAETYRLQRTWQAAEIYPEPVLKPETPWEGYQLVICGSVHRVGEEWRLYYMTYNRPDPMYLCMAVSGDGLRWERPNLGRVDYRGTKANNIVWQPPRGQSFTSVTVCHDAEDARAPFKMIYYGAGGENLATGHYVAFSADGLDWRWREQPVLTTTGDQTNVMGTRDHRGRFVAFLRHKYMLQRHRARSIWRSESPDFVHWTEPAPLLQADLLEDPNTELYGMTGFRYAGMYLGLIDHWQGNPDVIQSQLTWSHDGFAWHRPPVRAPFIASSYPWNRAWTSTVNTGPIRVSNLLRFYFGGRSKAHGQELGQVYGAVGMATLTVDRFAAIRADFKEGRLVTKPMTWPGGELVLNCAYTRYPQGFYNAGGGSIEVEVLDESGQPVAGYAGEARAKHNLISPFPWKTEERPVRWPADRSLRALAGRRIRLGFLLRDSRLYAFRSSG